MNPHATAIASSSVDLPLPFSPVKNVTGFVNAILRRASSEKETHLQSLTEEEKSAVKKGIKEGLEGLVDKVPGLIDVNVQIDGRLASSTADLMLDCTLEDEEALKVYAQHPEHLAVANTKVRPYTVQRACLDFEA